MDKENPFKTHESQEKKIDKSTKKEIPGDGFILKSDPHYFNPKTESTESNLSVQFRPGASNEEAVKEKGDKHKEELEKIKDWNDADDVRDMLDDMLKKISPYSETFRIRDDGTFDTNKRLDNSLPYITPFVRTPENLYQIAKEISLKHPEYHFNFENDPEGKWMKYTISKH